MSQLLQFRLPDVGEGLTEADILRWAVSPGDVVVVNQPLVEIETAKAAVELPSPYAGVVHTLHVQEGQTVAVGTPIITIQSSNGPADDAPAIDAAPGTGPASAGPPADPQTAGLDREPVLVGYGVGSRGTRRHRPSAQPAFDSPPHPAAGDSPSPPGAVDTARDHRAPTAAPDVARDHQPVLAKPPVRQLAKQLGVDLTTVPATGPHGTVSRADVEGAAALPVATGQREQRVPVRGVRKHTAAAMVSSAFTAPHVTEFITVDVTETMALRDRVAARPEFRQLKLSPLVFVARALLLAIPRTPSVNASWQDNPAGPAGATIVIKRYVNLGIAAATDRGLVVPTIADADRLSLAELARAINELSTTARAGKTTPAALTGGTITITNVGVFGVDTGTPIINPGEAAILAVGAVRRAPWVVDRDGSETIEARWVMQLALSFDHRVVDGAEGSTFLADVAALLRDPGLALL